MLTLTPFVLLITGGVALSGYLYRKETNFILWFLLVYILTFSLEVIGVKSGMIFGNYNYGNVLGFKVIDVPLIIGLNWVIVIAGAIKISELIFKQKAMRILNTGLLAVLFDLFLEPIAVYFNYWNWESDVIPLQNYIAWFIISILVAVLFYSFKIKLKDRILMYYFVIQSIFFATLSIILT